MRATAAHVSKTCAPEVIPSWQKTVLEFRINFVPCALSPLRLPSTRISLSVSVQTPFCQSMASASSQCLQTTGVGSLEWIQLKAVSFSALCHLREQNSLAYQLCPSLSHRAFPLELAFLSHFRASLRIDLPLGTADEMLRLLPDSAYT